MIFFSKYSMQRICYMVTLSCHQITSGSYTSPLYLFIFWLRFRLWHIIAINFVKCKITLSLLKLIMSDFCLRGKFSLKCFMFQIDQNFIPVKNFVIYSDSFICNKDHSHRLILCMEISSFLSVWISTHPKSSWTENKMNPHLQHSIGKNLGGHEHLW